MSITEHPEFKHIMMEAYDKAYLHGQMDERERCAKVADAYARDAGDNNDAAEIADEIRSGK